MYNAYNNQYVGIILTLTKVIGVDIDFWIRTPLVVGEKYYYRDDDHWEGRTTMSGPAGELNTSLNSAVQVPSDWEPGTVFGIVLDLKINGVVFNDVETFTDTFIIPSLGPGDYAISDVSISVE